MKNLKKFKEKFRRLPAYPALFSAVAAAVILGGIFTSCPGTSSSSGDDSKPPENGTQTTGDGETDGKTFIAFDNTQGVCTAIIYDDYRRREGDIVEVVRAGVSSEPRKWTAQSSCPFYFAYQFAVPGAEENTVIYTPQEASKNQTAARIDAGKTTTIPVPKLENTLNAPGALLSAQSYLIIQNNSTYSFQLQRGTSTVKPENLSGAVVNGGERALYKVEGGAAASAYTLLIGASSVPFPASPAQFAAGHVYRFVYDGSGVALSGNTQLDVAAVEAQGQDAGDIPAVPDGLAVTGETVDSVSLSWNTVNEAAGYRIYRAASADGVFFQIGSRAATQTLSYTNTGLSSGTAYYYKVSAVNAAGESAMSAAAAGKTNEPQAPPATPAGLTVTGVTTTSVDLSWNAASGASGYKVYRAASAGGTFAPIGTSDTNYYTDTGLAPGTVYYYKVSAVNAVGESAMSAAAAGTPEMLTVTELNLSGLVTAPVKDAAAQTTAAALSHSQYAVTSLTWQTSSGGAVSGAFAAGTVYKAALGLQAQGAYTFTGLGAGAFTFSGATAVTAAINGQTATVTVTFPATQAEVALNAGTADEFVTRLNWIKGNGVPDMDYVITLTADISIAPYTLNAGVSSMLRNTRVRLAGSGSERTISLNANGSLFTLEGLDSTHKFTFILGENIKLQGRNNNTASVVKVNQYAEFIIRGGTIGNNGSDHGGGVRVNGGTFTMSGGTISGNTSSSSYGGGVYVGNGSFTMSGGTVSGNTAVYGGGVYVSSGTFTMSGGTISGNTVFSSTYPHGGGVFVSSGSFTMSGGTVSGNTAFYGGGVYVSSGTFTMSGGTISGHSASQGGGVYLQSGTFTKSGTSIIYGNDAYDASLKNTASGYGHAVYTSDGRKRNATAYTGDTMDSSVSGYAGGWE